MHIPSVQRSSLSPSRTLSEIFLDELGPRYRLLAYLDDMHIAGPQDALQMVATFLEGRDNPLTL